MTDLLQTSVEGEIGMGSDVDTGQADRMSPCPKPDFENLKVSVQCRVVHWSEPEMKWV